MKSFENKKTSIKDGENIIFYRHIIELILNTTPQGGFTFKEIQERERISAVIQPDKGKEKTKFSFEDTDFNRLLQIAEHAHFTIRHGELLQFYKDLKAVS